MQAVVLVSRLDSAAYRFFHTDPQPFRVQQKNRESALVTSFVLMPVDGQSVVDFQPGQYLGVKVKPANSDYFEIRQYSVTDKPPLQSANFYLCGPTAFMKAVKDQLLALGVVAAQIHYEEFGPHAEL